MVDEFMVCVDRIIIATTCFADSSNGEALLTSDDANANSRKTDEKTISNNNNSGGSGSGEGCSKGSVIRECRICQEEDDETDMEAPCACNGTLKFAHRKCIQKWCNKKGDITCEICNKVFSPNYTLPPATSNPDVMAIDIRWVLQLNVLMLLDMRVAWFRFHLFLVLRQAWGPGMDIRNPHFLAFAAAERQFLQSEYDDYAIASSGSLASFRYVAIITLMVTRDFTMVQDSSTFFNFQVSLLQLAAFLLPCYVMARTWYMIQCRRRRQLLDAIKTNGNPYEISNGTRQDLAQGLSDYKLCPHGQELALPRYVFIDEMFYHSYLRGKT
ncbi:putative pentatricopeptide repeat-containing protein-like [Capsicum annuum]|nr:putative pentatricopeptide repeat-containing protein-like [Capsicum annuum]